MSATIDDCGLSVVGGGSPEPSPGAAINVGKDIHAAMARTLRIMRKILDTGDLNDLERWLHLATPGVERDGDDGQIESLRTLRALLADARRREEQAGGPGSLFIADHPFVVGCDEARKRAHIPLSVSSHAE